VKALVTGVTGRIGANLAAALVRDGHSVRGLVWGRDPRVGKLAPLGLELIEGSLTSAEDTRRAAEGVEAIYHLGAAFQGGGPFTTDEYFEINVRGAFNMLEAARAQGAALKHFVFSSTDAVYDKYVPGGMPQPIREDEMPRKPKGWYSLSKSVGEELGNGYFRSFKTPVTVLRFPTVLSVDEILLYRQIALSTLMKAQPDLAPLWVESRDEERLVLVRDPEGRPYMKHIADVRDVVHGCVCVLGNERAAGETFQLGSPTAFKWDELVPYLSEKTGVPYVDARSSAIPTYYEYDLSKARDLLGYRPEYGFERMVDDGVAWKKGEDIGVLAP
jgi:UDP-glucose 4-epimerase